MFKIAVGIVMVLLLAVGAAVALRLRAGQRHASRRNDSRRSGKVVVESDKGKGTKEVRS